MRQQQQEQQRHDHRADDQCEHQPEQQPGQQRHDGAGIGGGASLAEEYATVAAYVGGKVQTATGSPISIGWVNTDTGPAGFPLYTTAVQDAVAYANAHLDGINGHIIKLVTCNVTSEEDGQSCGATMVNNPNIQAIGEGILVFGSDTFFKVINNTKTVLQVDANSPSDFNPYPGITNPNVFTLSSGATGGYTAMITYAGKYASPAIKTMLLVGDNDPAVKAGITAFQGELSQFHITTKAAFINVGSGASQVAADIQGTGAANSDAWFMLTDEGTCASVYSYLKSTGLHPLIMGAECAGADFKPLTGGNYAATGLLTSSTGADIWLPTETPLMNAIYNEMNRAIPNVAAPDSASGGYITMFNLFRAMNAAGTNQTAQGIATAVRGLKAPILGNIGSINCGAVPNFSTICGAYSGLIQNHGATWTCLSPTAQIPAIQVWQFKS